MPTGIIVAGLGGTGCKVLDFFIEHLNEMKVSTDNYLFIFYDNDERSITDTKRFEELKPINYYDEKYRNAKNVLVLKPSDTGISYNQILDKSPWMEGKLPKNLMGFTAGNQRAIGAAVYRAVRDVHLNKIREKLVSLSRERGWDSVLVIVIVALGGGTGSGAMFYFGMDIFNLLDELGMSKSIFSIAILPKRVEDPLMRANAYKALDEYTVLEEMNWLKRRPGRLFNPFVTQFLISRNLFTNDIELYRVISDFIYALAQSQYDYNDIVARITNTGGHFTLSTFAVYDILLPVQKITWLKNYANPTLSTVEQLKQDLQENIRKLTDNSNKISSRITFVSNEIEKIRKEIDELKANNSIWEKFGAKLNTLQSRLVNLQNKINEINPSVYLGKANEALKMLEDYYEELKGKQEKLIEELKTTATRYEFMIPLDLNKINMEDIKNFSIVELANKYVDIKHQLEIAKNNIFSAPARHIVADIDFDQISKLESTDPRIIEFIRKHQMVDPSMRGVWHVENDKLKKPGISSAMVSVFGPPNLKTVFNEDQMVATFNLFSNRDVRFTTSDYRKYEIIIHWMLVGIYPYKLDYEKGYILKDLEFLKKGYEDLIRNNPAISFYLNTLFYDKEDYLDFHTHIIRYTNCANVISVDKIKEMSYEAYANFVSECLSKFDPSDLSIHIPGLLLVARLNGKIEAIHEYIKDSRGLVDRIFFVINNAASSNVLVSQLRERLELLHENIRNMNSQKITDREIELLQLVIDKNKRLANKSLMEALDDFRINLETVLKDLKDAVKFYEEKISDLKDMIQKNSDDVAKTWIIDVQNYLINLVDILIDLNKDIEKIYNVMITK